MKKIIFIVFCILLLLLTSCSKMNYVETDNTESDSSVSGNSVVNSADASKNSSNIGSTNWKQSDDNFPTPPPLPK